MQTKKLTLAGVLCAVAVVGSLLSFPAFGGKCAPVQHIVNIVCGMALGPGYAIGVAFCASLVRNVLGLGSLLAFPGSMIGAALCALAYQKTKSIPWTLAGEVFGTAVLGGVCAYPIAIAFLGQSAANIGIFAYVIPFLISTGVGAVLSLAVVMPLMHAKILRTV